MHWLRFQFCLYAQLYCLELEIDFVSREQYKSGSVIYFCGMVNFVQRFISIEMVCNVHKTHRTNTNRVNLLTFALIIYLLIVG